MDEVVILGLYATGLNQVHQASCWHLRNLSPGLAEGYRCKDAGMDGRRKKQAQGTTEGQRQGESACRCHSLLCLTLCSWKLKLFVFLPAST